MKQYTYEFVDETVHVELTEEWNEILKEFDRLEYNNNHAQTRRTYSLDSSEYEGTDFECECYEITHFAEREDIRNALDRLTKRQREYVVACYFMGATCSEIARYSEISETAVRHVLSDAKKKLKKFLD